ncbi:Aste57867_5818 [Aphanomyces stellatus]|uniref:Aste57867_5818 protein n=1 Tax=Aphanomyces stellatus TaxID=120398 RepID=A0A485KH83_9STRA|nr:hypothetical protein As57867_005804 [Aphanomyces stellatus]VFT82841.1 Aste57867_5818 [Aphanomyces stellatus]
MSTSVLPSINSSSPWGAVPIAAPTNFRSIMDETVAANIEWNDVLAALVQESSDVTFEASTVDEDTSSDFAMAMALQLEEQAAANTVDYSRLASMFQEVARHQALPAHSTPSRMSTPPMDFVAVDDDEVVIPSLRHRSPRRKSAKPARRQPKRDAAMSMVIVDESEDAFDTDEALDGLFDLFFSAFDAFHEVAHEIAFCDADPNVA